MSDDQEVGPIDEFRKVLEEGEDVGTDLTEQGRDRTKKGQDILDLSRSTKKVLDEIPKNYQVHGIEEAIEDWSFYVSSARRERDRYHSTGVDLISSASGTANIFSSDLFEEVSYTIPEDPKQKFTVALAEFNEVLGRSANKTEAIDLFILLKLDKPFHDRRSALEQFEIAYNAMERPVSGKTDPAQTSLIPMREAIETSLDHLLFLRPDRSNIGDFEGPNKDWRKIVAISNQLKKENVPDQLIQSWARDWTNLKDDLSSAKIDLLDRNEWSRLLNKSTLFVISFFNGLDPSRII